MAKMIDLGRVVGKDGVYVRNLLDNSDFEIAQAGYVSAHGSLYYAADRWHLIGDLDTFGIVGDVKTVRSSDGYHRIEQYLWNDGRDKGKTYTLVLTLEDGTRVTCSGTSPSSDVTGQEVIAQTHFGNGGAILIIKEARGVFYVRIAATSTGSSISFLHVDLFEGEYTAENAPTHVPKGYAAELAECRLYYKVIKNSIVQVSPNIQAYYRASSIFYEPMRIEPSVVFVADANGRYGLCANVAYITDIDDISIVNRENGCLGLATTNEAFAGRTMQIYEIVLDADLT